MTIAYDPISDGEQAFSDVPSGFQEADFLKEKMDEFTYILGSPED
ncbi:hypothetical protein [Novosphingobium sp. LASN5T]|nr:hypothetical protein [Novosphingobium sp. LASN5T]